MTKKKSPTKADLEQQLGELTADLQRIHADFTNFKRRAEEDKQRAIQLGKEGVILDLLPTIDNLERALGHLPKELEKNEWALGVAKIATQLQKLLADLGIVRIETVGQEFNPELMEAVGVEDGDSGVEVVSEELQSGYVLDGEIIRHAMVRVKRK